MIDIKQLPDNTQSIIKRLIEQGCIDVENERVDLTLEMAQLLLILDRAGVFVWFINKTDV